MGYFIEITQHHFIGYKVVLLSHKQYYNKLIQ